MTPDVCSACGSAALRIAGKSGWTACRTCTHEGYAVSGDAFEPDTPIPAQPSLCNGTRTGGGILPAPPVQLFPHPGLERALT